MNGGRPYFRPQDPQDDNGIADCCWCGGEIYSGESVLETDNGFVCSDCVSRHTREIGAILEERYQISDDA